MEKQDLKKAKIFRVKNDLVDTLVDTFGRHTICCIENALKPQYIVF